MVCNRGAELDEAMVELLVGSCGVFERVLRPAGRCEEAGRESMIILEEMELRVLIRCKLDSVPLTPFPNCSRLIREGQPAVEASQSGSCQTLQTERN